MFAAEIRRRRAEPMRAASTCRWHLDVIVVKIIGERHHLWSAVNYEGEVVEAVVTKPRDRLAALKLLGNRWSVNAPRAILTDSPPSHGAALKSLGGRHLRDADRSLDNRAETSHLPLPRARAGDPALTADTKSADFRRRPSLRLQALPPGSKRLLPPRLHGRTRRCACRAVAARGCLKDRVAENGDRFAFVRHLL